MKKNLMQKHLMKWLFLLLTSALLLTGCAKTVLYTGTLDGRDITLKKTGDRYDLIAGNESWAIDYAWGKEDQHVRLTDGEGSRLVTLQDGRAMEEALIHPATLGEDTTLRKNKDLPITLADGQEGILRFSNDELLFTPVGSENPSTYLRDKGWKDGKLYTREAEGRKQGFLLDGNTAVEELAWQPVESPLLLESKGNQLDIYADGGEERLHLYTILRARDGYTLRIYDEGGATWQEVVLKKQ